MRRRALRVMRPAREKKRLRRVLVVATASPRAMRPVQRARLWAITWTASQAALAAYGHRDVLVRGYVNEVVISCGAEVIARHPRSYERDDFVFDPIHYLPLLERKTAALDQAAPLQGWDLTRGVRDTAPPAGGQDGKEGQAGIRPGAPAPGNLLDG